MNHQRALTQSISRNSILNQDNFHQEQKNIIFTLTGFDIEKKREILSLTYPTPLQVSYLPTLNETVNVLVCNKVLSDKYIVAVKRGISIVTPNYLISCHRAGKWLPFDGYQCPPLFGLKISCTGFTELQRLVLQKKIESGGAIYHTSMIRNETTHLIVNVGADQSIKSLTASSWNIKTLREDWVYQSLHSKFAQEEDSFLVFPPNTNEQNLNVLNPNPIDLQPQIQTQNHRDNSFTREHLENRQNFRDTSTNNQNNLELNQSIHSITLSNRKLLTQESGTRITLVPFPPISRQVNIQDFFLPDYNLFEKCTVYLLGYNTYPALLQKTTQLLLQHGALILPIIIPHRLTHVIVYKPTESESDLLQNSFILSDISMSVVMHRWIDDCIQENILLDETEYLYL